jgi:hypothetical protein
MHVRGARDLAMDFMASGVDVLSQHMTDFLEGGTAMRSAGAKVAGSFDLDRVEVPSHMKRGGDIGLMGTRLDFQSGLDAANHVSEAGVTPTVGSHRLVNRRSRLVKRHRNINGRSLTTHLRLSSQEGGDGHEGVFAAKANSGAPSFRQLSSAAAPGPARRRRGQGRASHPVSGTPAPAPASHRDGACLTHGSYKP